MRVQLGPIVIDLIDEWADVTDDLTDESEPPLTLARQSADACGSLQFSFAIYKGGWLPNPSPDMLADLLREFGEKAGLVTAGEKHVESQPMRLAAETFRDGNFVIRAWYVSDGSSVAKITYTAGVADEFAVELAECEQMVRTIRFPRVGGAA